MSKHLLSAACAALLAACSPTAPAPPSPTASALAAPSAAMCAPPASREVAFTAPDAKDTLAAAAIGADCRQASILFTLNKADGALVWSIGVPASRTWAFMPDPDEKDPTPQKSVSAYMDATLKAASIIKSNETPDWPAGKDSPQEKTGLGITTELTRDTYLEIRAKDAPVLCVEPTMGVGRCFYLEPNDASGSLTAEPFYEMHS